MQEPFLDRRVRRTRHRLKEALLELLEERDYEAITVTDITRRADVGRSTFYSHYASKEELLFAGFDRWLLSLPEAGSDDAAGDGPVRFRFSLPLLRHIGSQRRFFRATIVGGSDVGVRRRTTELLVEMARREIEREPIPDATGEEAGLDRASAVEARAHGVVGAFLGLASWWLHERPEASPEAVDRLFRRSVAGPAAG